MKSFVLLLSLSIIAGQSLGQQPITSVDSVTRLMQRHFEICNEPDTLRRHFMMKEVYDEHIYSVDPVTAVNGHAGMIAAIEGLHKAMPGYLLTITGPVDTHHNVARFPYSLGKPGEKAAVTGWDIIVFKQGRITHIYTFVTK
jgi:hypothetical protein